jgi:predicted ABC-type transport system involved in lysophospholipase L1 biosynthesis ATPase subunit
MELARRCDRLLRLKGGKVFERQEISA